MLVCSPLLIMYVDWIVSFWLVFAEAPIDENFYLLIIVYTAYILISLFQNDKKHILVNKSFNKFEKNAVSTIHMLVCSPLLIMHVDWIVSFWC